MNSYQNSAEFYRKFYSSQRSKPNLFQMGIPIGNGKIHKRGDSPVFEIDFVFPIWHPLCQIVAYDEIEIVFTNWM